MPNLRRPTQLLAVACLFAATMLGFAPGPAAALEPPRPLPDHRPIFVTETDVRPWKDCLWASASMLLDKWTNGDVRVSHGRLRRLSGDAAGGSSLADMAVAFRRLGFRVDLDANGDSTLTWGALLARLRHGAGAVILGDYAKLPRWYGRWDYRFWKGKAKTDNHAVYVDRYDARHGRVWLMDPLARGEWRGEWISVRSLARYAWFMGGRVQAVATPVARPAPFAGVSFGDATVGLSSVALTASWAVDAPRRWRFPGADVTATTVRAEDPLLAAARSAASPSRVTHNPAPPRPFARVAAGALSASAALPVEPGAYTMALRVTDRRFGDHVATSNAVAVFVPGERHAALQPVAGETVQPPGATIRVAITVTNDGEVSWADPGPADAKAVGRTAPQPARGTRVVAAWVPLPDALPAGAPDAAVPDPVVLQRVSLAPGQAVRVDGSLRVPAGAGRWALVIDLEDDVDGSFAGLGSAPAVVVYKIIDTSPGKAPDLPVE